MGDVLNRTTKELKLSVNSPDFPTATWIINPDLSALSGVASKYWNIVEDVVSEMSQSEKDTVDSDELSQHKTDCKAVVQKAYDDAIRNADLTQKNTADSDIDAATTVASVTQIADDFTG